MSTLENDRLREITESFGLIFLLERKFTYLFDRIFAPYSLTAKQWLVLAAIEKMWGESPSINQVADELSTSHQNIKAIAMNLEKIGFVTLEKDRKDKRITRLTTTAKSKAFWKQREHEDILLLSGLFGLLSDQDKVTLWQSLHKLLQGANELTAKINEEAQSDQ